MSSLYSRASLIVHEHSSLSIIHLFKIYIDLSQNNSENDLINFDFKDDLQIASQVLCEEYEDNIVKSFEQVQSLKHRVT
jgi:hypothetical protein